MANNTSDKAFYAGPSSRFRELRFVWRVFVEFIRGFRALHFSGPCVTVFGSARFPEGHPYYVLAQKVGAAIANLGFTVMTGGGPGIMEAANRGAKDAGGTTIAILPGESHADANPWADHVVVTGIGHARNLAVAATGHAVVAIGGSYGTLAEIGFAMRLGRPVVVLEGGPSVAGVPRASTPEEAVEAVLARLG